MRRTEFHRQIFSSQYRVQNLRDADAGMHVAAVFGAHSTKGDWREKGRICHEKQEGIESGLHQYSFDIRSSSYMVFGGTQHRIYIYRQVHFPGGICLLWRHAGEADVQGIPSIRKICFRKSELL